MYNYYELVAVCETIATKIDTVISLLETNLTPLLYIITFAVFLKVGFTCLRGYKV